jgi:hexosaminidase
MATLDFLPQPQKVTSLGGSIPAPKAAAIGISDQTLFAEAKRLRAMFGGRGQINAAVTGVDYDVTLELDETLKPTQYKLTVNANGVSILGQSVAAVAYGITTLGQVVDQSPAGKLAQVKINDWPEIPDRGVYYDLARCRVPTLDELKKMADNLAAYKINQLQLYIEHTFAFRRHPVIGKGASPLSAEDIMELDAYCAERHIELLPSLSTFGHMATVLKNPEYHHLANSGAENGYYSITPGLPAADKFLRELLDEFLPCFRSNRVNVCCDEVYDVGENKSKALGDKTGKGPLYLNHILMLRDVAAEHGKTILIWGDIIRTFPELIPQIPKDVTLLDWGYTGRLDYDRLKDFTDTGLPAYGCPSVNGYFTLFPRIHDSLHNIVGWARSVKKHGGIGLLNTDWGDGGHYNFHQSAYVGYLAGAEFGWNTRADMDTYFARFCKLFMKIDSKEFVNALVRLGEIAHVDVRGYYMSILTHLLFFCGTSEDHGYLKPEDTVYTAKDRPIGFYEDGKYVDKETHLTSKDGSRWVRELKKIHATFAKFKKVKGTDPQGVLDYWLWAVEAMTLAAMKLEALGVGGMLTAERKRKMVSEYKRLRKRFETLWMRCNRRSEIKYTLGYFDRETKRMQKQPVNG